MYSIAMYIAGYQLYRLQVQGCILVPHEKYEFQLMPLFIASNLVTLTSCAVHTHIYGSMYEQEQQIYSCRM